MNKIRKEFEYGGHKVSLEAGNVAKQASGAVVASMGDTVVLCTVVAMPNANPGQDFFPLTVNYQERTYAAGKIPGSFFRREGRPSEKETLTCRLIDRPIRPLFPKGFMNEVQVIPTVMSVDKDMDPDIISMIGTSAALAISGVPFAGPIGAARVGFEQGQYSLNPGYEALADSNLNMVVAGTESAVLMVESEAAELSEDQMLGAVLFGHQEMQVAIKAISEMASDVGNEAWEFAPPIENEELADSVRQAFGDGDSAFHRARITDCPDDADEAFFLEESESGLCGDLSFDPDPGDAVVGLLRTPACVGNPARRPLGGSAGPGVMRQRL